MRDFKTRKNNRVSTLLSVALIVILALTIINLIFITSRINKIEKAKELLAEKNRPANLEVTKIIPSECSDCYSIDLALEGLRKQNVNITSEVVMTEEEASSLVSQYGITKLPALIIEGEVNKTEQLNKFFNDNGEMIGSSTAVYTNIKPPFYDVENKKVLGRVSLITIADSSCKNCPTMQSLISLLAQSGVAITSEKTFEYNSVEGKDLIDKYSIKAAPTILVSEDIEIYPEIKKQLDDSEVKKIINYYVVPSTSLPRRDLEQDKIIGLVDLISLKDASCTECYDVNNNKPILTRFGIVINKENDYDIDSTEGKDLINKYNITKIPIILISPEISEYETFEQIWADVGSIEEDGWYVMRNPELLGNYKDLVTNKVVEVSDGQ